MIINGPPGVGKTTVARSLSALLPGTVHIEGDALRAFAPADARQHLGGGSTYRAAATLARAYLLMGARRVIFDYVFLEAAHLRCFRESVEEVSLHVFTLWAPLDLWHFVPTEGASAEEVAEVVNALVGRGGACARSHAVERH